MSARVLTPDEEDLAFEYGIKGLSLAKTAEVLGFNNDMAFFKYRQTHPEFSKALNAARLAGTDHFEDKLVTVADDYNDPQVARVKMESLCRVLSYRDPTRYGNKVDITLTQTVDIGGSLTRMQARLVDEYRTALPSAIDVTPKITNKINDLL